MIKFLLITLSFILIPVLTVGAEEAVPSKMEPSAIVIQAQDWLLITITPEDSYIKGGRMQVSAEGDLNFDLIGRVHVAGKTVEELEKDLIQRIDADYLVRPNVKIEVLEQYSAAQSVKV